MKGFTESIPLKSFGQAFYSPVKSYKALVKLLQKPLVGIRINQNTPHGNSRKRIKLTFIKQ